MSFSTLWTGEWRALLRRGALAQGSEWTAFLGKQDAWTLCSLPSVFGEVFPKSRLSASFSHINRPLGEVSIQFLQENIPRQGQGSWTRKLPRGRDALRYRGNLAAQWLFPSQTAGTSFDLHSPHLIFFQDPYKIRMYIIREVSHFSESSSCSPIPRASEQPCALSVIFI